jgi:hypothetical protein
MIQGSSSFCEQKEPKKLYDSGASAPHRRTHAPLTNVMRNNPSTPPRHAGLDPASSGPSPTHTLAVLCHPHANPVIPRANSVIPREGGGSTTSFSSFFVMPAKAGIHDFLPSLSYSFRHPSGAFPTALRTAGTLRPFALRSRGSTSSFMRVIPSGNPFPQKRPA